MSNSMPTLTTVLSGWSFLEGVRWHDGRLWVSDFYTHTVICADAQGAVQETISVPDQPSGLGWLPDGRLLIAGQLERKVFRVEPDGAVVVHADLAQAVASHLNDMYVSSSGYAYVGEFGFDLHGGAPPRTGRIMRVSPDGNVSVAAEDVWFPNGMVVTRDGTLVVAETLANRLSGFALADDGTLGERRAWAAFGDPPRTDDVVTVLTTTDVAPDGIAIDAQDGVWAADPSKNRVVRAIAGGTITDEVSTGDLGAFSCALGGPEGRTLYIAASPSFLAHECRDTRNAVLLATEVAVPAC
jgi:sugar lactone lactonase YvrE